MCTRVFEEASMRKTVCVLVLALPLIFSIAALPQLKTRTDPAWAFPVINGALPPEAAGPKTVPGTNKTYTQAQIDDLNNPPDWFPEEHVNAPQIVKYGHGDALACGACHLMSGQGHPESADLAGHTAAYIMQQLADFKSG